MTKTRHARPLAGVMRVVGGVAVGLSTIAVVLGPGQAASAATDVVTNCNASGPGSLASEVAGAGSGDTVTFALSPACSAINLTGTITIGVDLTIDGPGAGALTVNGSGGQSVFSVGSVTATISGLSIENGGGAEGGGIDNSGTLTVADSTVSNNTTTSGGGGIFNSGTLTVADSTVSNNSSYGGGGIQSEFATLTVTNSTVADNSASQFGGGIYIYDSYDPSQPIAATITNSTLSGDSAPFGGAISDDQGPVAMGATIVANNPTGGDCYLELASLTDYGYNLADDSSCGLSGTGDLSSTPAGLDPAGLQGNGGPTPTVALEPGSAAIDHVSNATLCPAADQRGMTRQVPCDVGAYDTDVAVVVPCTPGTTGCSATITAPSQTVFVSGAKLVTTTATISLSVATQVLSCPGFGYSAPVATLTDTGLKSGTALLVTDTVIGLPSPKGVLICYQPSGPNPPAPTFLKKCHGKKPVACYKSFKESGGNVVATLQLPTGDPRFHVGAEVPVVTSVSPAAAAPGKKLTVKGANLSEVTHVTVGGVSARITKTAPTKVIVTVPPGAKSGVVRVTSLAGTASSPIVFRVT